MKPLEQRKNPTNWSTLLDLALPPLDHTLKDAPFPAWTLGGGTAIALRIEHRLSDDIDIFVPGLRLRALSPAQNPYSAAISDDFQWPGHYLKFLRPEGEIDFLSPPLQSEPGFTTEQYKGRPIALETLTEVLVKKIRYRAAGFTMRDAFDLAAIDFIDPNSVTETATYVPDALPRLRQALKNLQTTGQDPSKFIRPTVQYRFLVPDCVSRSLPIVDRMIAAETGICTGIDRNGRQILALAAITASAGAPAHELREILSWANAGPFRVAAQKLEAAIEAATTTAIATEIRRATPLMNADEAAFLHAKAASGNCPTIAKFLEGALASTRRERGD